MERPNQALFAPHLHTRFLAESPAGTAELDLIEITTYPDHYRHADFPEPFALLFRGPWDPALPQRLYTLRHESLEPIQLSLVPTGREQAGRLYEAVFH